MFGEWTGSWGPAAVISGLGLLVTLGGFAIAYFKGVGLREADHANFAKRFEALENRVTAAEARFMPGATIDKRFEDADRTIGALTASGALLREQFSETSRRAAETYATKVELAALEDRTNKGMDRIVDRLEQISGRLEVIGDMIVKSLAERRA